MKLKQQDKNTTCLKMQQTMILFIFRSLVIFFFGHTTRAYPKPGCWRREQPTGGWRDGWVVVKGCRFGSGRCPHVPKTVQVTCLSVSSSKSDSEIVVWLVWVRIIWFLKLLKAVQTSWKFAWVQCMESKKICYRALSVSSLPNTKKQKGSFPKPRCGSVAVYRWDHLDMVQNRQVHQEPPL